MLLWITMIVALMLNRTDIGHFSESPKSQEDSFLRRQHGRLFVAPWLLASTGAFNKVVTCIGPTHHAWPKGTTCRLGLLQGIHCCGQNIPHHDVNGISCSVLRGEPSQQNTAHCEEPWRGKMAQVFTKSLQFFSLHRQIITCIPECNKRWQHYKSSPCTWFLKMWTDELANNHFGIFDDVSCAMVTINGLTSTQPNSWQGQQSIF
jgi:hypothetical protein